MRWVEITGFKEPLKSVIYLQMMGCLPSCLEPQASASRGREENILDFERERERVLMQWWNKKQRRSEWETEGDT